MTPLTHQTLLKTQANGNRTDYCVPTHRDFGGQASLSYKMVKTAVELRKIQAVLKADIYARLAADLQDLLLHQWNVHQREAINNTLRALDRPQEFTRSDLAKMIRGLREELGPAYARDVRAGVYEIVTGAYSNGIQQVLQVKPSFNMVDTQAINWLKEHNIFWVRNHFNRQLQQQVTALGEQVIREGLSRRAAGKLFEEAFYDSYSPQTWRYWEGFANHVVTRSREFGRVEGYVKAGVTKIMVDAVLDHRTSTICRHMHGRIIQVSDAVELRDTMMAAASPEDVIEIAPFMRPDDVAGTATSDLKSKSAGFALPPYHYDCRTRTVKYRAPYEKNTVVDTTQGNALTEEQREQLTGLTHDEQSNVLQSLRTRSQLRYARKDFAADWKDHGGDFPDIHTKKEYRLRANSNMKAAERITTHAHDGEKQYRFFGPDGITVVDGGASIRGFYYHADAESLNKSFDGLLKRSLWLETKKTS